MHPDLELITPAQIIAAAPKATQRLDNPYKVPSHAKFKHPRSGKLHSIKTGVIPDKLFGIQNIRTGKQLFIMLEVHRTVPLTSSYPNRHTVLKTLAAYLRMNARSKHKDGQPIYKKHFGIPNMVVLWATTSQQKVDNILQLIEHLTDGKPSGLFLISNLSMHEDQHLSPRPDVHMLEFEFQRCRQGAISMVNFLEL